ncbi:MAG: hypothetical protein JWP35_4627 [Caulobacter sp.]|nr:hypothetical protein [Caulobacter sp.]
MLTGSGLAHTEIWVGAALGDRHILHLAQLVWLPLAAGLLFGLRSFDDPDGAKSLGRRIAPAVSVYGAVWLMLEVLRGALHHAAGLLSKAIASLIGVTLFVLLTSIALYAVQGGFRYLAVRRAAG